MVRGNRSPAKGFRLVRVCGFLEEVERGLGVGVDVDVADVIEVEVGIVREGTCRRNISHGKMKYRGSTSGAVTRLAVVARIQIRNQLVLGPSPCAITCLTDS